MWCHNKINLRNATVVRPQKREDALPDHCTALNGAFHKWSRSRIWSRDRNLGRLITDHATCERLQFGRVTMKLNVNEINEWNISHETRVFRRLQFKLTVVFIDYRLESYA